MTSYEKLTPALRQWVDQAVSRVPEEDRYQQRRELAEQTQALYEGFCAAGQAEQAEALTLDRLGSATAAAETQREQAGRKKRRLAQGCLILSAAAVLVSGVQLLFYLGEKLNVEFVVAGRPIMAMARVESVAAAGGFAAFAVLMLIGSLRFYASVKKQEKNRKQ